MTRAICFSLAHIALGTTFTLLAYQWQVNLQPSLPIIPALAALMGLGNFAAAVAYAAEARRG